VGQPSALYNLSNDIGETEDLAATQPGDVDSLKSLYDQWNTGLISPLWWKRSDFQIKPLVLAGDWNGFNKDDSTEPWQLTWISAPAVDGTPDAFEWYKNTVHVAATGGDTTPGMHSFAVVGINSYSRQWGGVTINIDATTSIPFFSGSALGPTNSISFDDGFYYSFRIIDPYPKFGLSLQLAVMKTSAPPVSVSWSGQTPTTPTSDDPVIVSMVTSQPKSVEERIYLRWSTDFFITSNVVEATGSGVDYSATIPAQPAGTGVQYSIPTSTVDLSPFVTSGIIDALTLATTPTVKFMVSDTADLKIMVTDGKSVVVAGKKDTYTIAVTNAGPSNVTGAAVSDIFPSTFTGVTFTATESGGASGFTPSGSGNISDTVTMPSGSKITYKAHGRISGSATGTISDTATVTAPIGVVDPNLANNSATDTDTLQ
jgi:uncharacterized repeat protein (TIGR01451 family)